MGWHGPTGACGCCGGCRKVGFFAGTEGGVLDATYTGTRFFSDFALQEGATESGAYNQPNTDDQTLPGSFDDRIALDAGERMQPPAAVLASDCEAWFQMIELDGDADLAWDGGTIELRASAGTVTAAGQTVPILADTELITYRTRLVLYVSGAWYGVFVSRYHQTGKPSGGNHWTTTRGSIQVVDRVNDVSLQQPTLTGVADTKVYLWTIADATVRVSGGYEYGEVTDRCAVPQLPAGTERAWQYQTAGTLSYNYWGTARTYPDTFDLDPNPEVTTGGSTGRVAAGYAGVTTLDNSFDWLDIIDGNVFILDGDSVGTIGSGYFGPSVAGRGNGPVINYYADFYVSATASLGVEFYHQTIWRNGTPAEPYRRPVIRHYLRARRPPQFETTFADVVPGADGKAPATLSVFVGFDGDVLTIYGICFTDCTIGWSGE